MLWFYKKYYEPGPQWSWLPPEHRPDGARALHDDYRLKIFGFVLPWWLWPFELIPRTWTSFEFDTAGTSADKVYWDNKQNLFEWKGKVYMKPWVPQVTHVFWKGGHGIYWCFDLFGYRFRFGPRITDDLENGPGYCYITYVPIPIIGWFLTFGCKKI